MSQSKSLLNLLFNSWTKTHELSSRIIQDQTRRNNIKGLQANYRRFQDEITDRYQPGEEIDEGLLRYHHHLVECQYLTILELKHKLASKSFKLNPFPRRMENFELNREQRSKIEFSSFLEGVVEEREKGMGKGKGKVKGGLK